MNIRLLPLAAAACALLASCCCNTRAPRVPIEGMWVRPYPYDPCKLQGFALFPGGKCRSGPARSVNMCSPLYDSWSLRHGKLTLSGQSVATGQQNPFSTVYDVKCLSYDTLVLKNCCGERVYRRLNVPIYRSTRPCPCSF